MMSGRYRSHFKGHGMQFSEHRLYVPGDDVRHIDWKVSARGKEPLVKKYEEERELTVFLVIDVSGSESFGSNLKLKSEAAAEVAGMLAYAASHTGDQVGVLLFGGEIERIIPPKKGRQHILRIIRDVLTHESTSRGTRLKEALESTGRIMKHSGVIFLISDFIASDYEIALKRLSRRHEVVALSIRDERETAIPDVGHILFVDPETGDEAFVDTSSYVFKKWVKEQEALLKRTNEAFKRAGIEQVALEASSDYSDSVIRFFRARSKARRPERSLK